MSGDELHLEVDRERCVGAGQCTVHAPELFDQDDDGLVRLERMPGPEDEAAVRAAADYCPSGAIHVTQPGNDDA